MDHVDAIVIGAGAVGLSIGRRIAQAGLEVVVLEAADAIGTGVSSRSSEVIHAGIYYPRDSLKARLCVAGRHQLYDYCRDHGVETSRIGKFIVATNPSQLDALEGIRVAAAANGVADVTAVSARAFHEQEPEVTCELALFSPSTGIIDSHGFMLALHGDIEAAGGIVALTTPFVRAKPVQAGFEVHAGGETPMTLGCRFLINAAGLSATSVAHAVHGQSAKTIPVAYYAQGAYFTAPGIKAPFRHLIYPIPEPGGLGVHVTLDLGGQVRFGPDVCWVTEPIYEIAPERAKRFYPAIRSYWPGLPDGSLVPAYAGVRPKISGPSDPAADFLIQTPDDSGLPGLVNLFGIESPGITSSLAIADHVADILKLS